MTLVYKDTYESCQACSSGTYVLYPDDVTRCRYCGKTKTTVKVVGKKTNG